MKNFSSSLKALNSHHQHYRNVLLNNSNGALVNATAIGIQSFSSWSFSLKKDDPLNEKIFKNSKALNPTKMNTNPKNRHKPPNSRNNNTNNSNDGNSRVKPSYPKEEIIKRIQQIKQFEESIQENSLNENSFPFTERHTISILYHYHQILIQQPNYPLDLYISNYLRQNNIGKNNKHLIISTCYEIEKLFLLLDFLTRNYDFKVIESKLLTSLDQYINRINQMKIKQLGPNSHLLPKSVTFVEENKRSVLHWRLIYFIFLDRFYGKNFVDSIKEISDQFGDIPKNILLSCPSQLFDLFKEDYEMEKAIELSLINLTQAPAFARLNDVKFNNNTNNVDKNNNLGNTSNNEKTEIVASEQENNQTNQNKGLLKRFINRLASNYSELVGQISMSEKCSLGFKFENRAEFRQWKEYKEGLFDIQDESSQIIVEELIRNIVMKNVKTSKPLILDYCCGTGGKTFAFAGCLNGKGQIYMHDVRSEKLFPELKRRALRMGIENIQPIEHSHSHWEKMKDKMNLVICDVPCTGTGTLRRNVEAKYKINYQWLKELTEKQREIVQEAIPYVKVDGYLVYSTCSVLNKENEKQLEWLLKKYKNFQLVHTTKILPSIDGGDGMYGVLLKRIN